MHIFGILTEKTFQQIEALINLQDTNSFTCFTDTVMKVTTIGSFSEGRSHAGNVRAENTEERQEI